MNIYFISHVLTLCLIKNVLSFANYQNRIHDRRAYIYYYKKNLPELFTDSLEQFAVRTEGQGNYIVDVWTETEDISIFAGVVIAPMRPG